MISRRSSQIWKVALSLCGALLLGANVGRSELNAPGGVAPQAEPLALRVSREEPASITLRCSGAFGLIPQFRIRNQPRFGTLSQPRLVSKDSAVVLYTPNEQSTAGEDQFLYSVQTLRGVSTPVPVTIRLFDRPAVLIVSDEVDFGKVQVGQSVRRKIQITNRGGSVAEGTFNLQGDFAMTGGTSYHLEKGEAKELEVIYRPTTAGRTSSAIIYTSHPDRETTLSGEGIGLIQVTPSQLELVAAPGLDTRRGHLNLQNLTSDPQTVQIHAAPELKLPETLQLPPNGNTTVEIALDRTLPRAIQTEIEFLVDGYSQRARIMAAALGPILKLTSPQIQFGQVPANQSAIQRIGIENVGGSRGEGGGSIEGPFELRPSGGFAVEPGTTEMLQIELKSGAPGPKSSLLVLHTNAGKLEVPVEALVVTTPSRISAEKPVPLVQNMSSQESPIPTQMTEAVPKATHYSRSLKALRLTAIGRTHCGLNWEIPPNGKSRLESARAEWDSKEGMRLIWEAVPSAVLDPQGNTMQATIRGLHANTFYKFRVVSPDESGVQRAVTTHLDLRTGAFPVIVTPLRLLLLCLVLLLGFMARRRWSGR